MTRVTLRSFLLSAQPWLRIYLTMLSVLKRNVKELVFYSTEKTYELQQCDVTGRMIVLRLL